MAGILIRRLLVAFVGMAGLSGVLAACGSAGATSTSAPQLRVVDARCPLPASPDVGVVYFTVENHGGSADRLVSATTDVAQQAAVHQEVRKGLLITMQPTGPVSIPAHKSLVLSVGGTHLMLVGLTRPFQLGDRFVLHLRFERAGDVDVSVPVVPAAS